MTDERCDPAPQRRAPECDDQLPLFSTIGRGIKGDTYRVRVVRQDSDEMYLVGENYDHATKVWTTEWESNNLSGGELLEVEYNFMPSTTPPTFTMTFMYRHPSVEGKEGSPYKTWEWTTPAIPYFPADPEAKNYIGSGVANLYVRDGVGKAWKDTHHTGGAPPMPVTSDTGRWGQLNFPTGTTPKDYRTPSPTEKWAATLTFGVGGDVEVPNIDDIAKVIGITKQQFIDIVNGSTGVIDGSDNVIDYVNDNIKKLSDHIHTDMGWGQSTLLGDNPNSKIPAITNISTWTRPAAGAAYTIKNYIDYLAGRTMDYTDDEIDDLRIELKKYIDDSIAALKKYVDDKFEDIDERLDDIESDTTNINNKLARHDKTLADILAKFYGGGTINDTTGAVTWGVNKLAPVGDINIYSGAVSGTGAPTANNGLFTHAAVANNDLDFQ